MATILNRQTTFATNGTVTAAGLHNLIDQTEIYAGIITTQDQIASVGSSDQLLIADADETSTSAPRRVTVGSMFNDALSNGIYTTGSFTNRVTAGSFVGNLTGNVTGTIVGTTGTIATLNSTTSTITNLSATTSTFLGTITGSTNVINIGSGQIYKDASGNVGIGVTPSGWGTSEYKAIQVGIGGSISGRVSGGDQDKVNVAANIYNDGTVFKYIASDEATIYQQTGGIHIFSNAPSGTAGSTATFTERLRIDGSGNVKIGTATQLLSSANILEVSGANGIGIKATGGAGNPCMLAWNSDASGNNTFAIFYTEASPSSVGSIDFNRASTLTRYNTTSDATLKNIIGDSSGEESVSILKNTKIRDYTWKKDITNKVNVGVVAQELYEVFKGAVSVGGDIVSKDSEGNDITTYRPWGVDKTAFTFHLVAGWKAHEKLIQELKSENDSLKSRIEALEAA